MGDLSLHLTATPITGPLETVKYINFLKALRCRRQRATHININPLDATIDMATVCHLHCPHCSTGNGTIQRGASFMSPEQFTRIIDDIGDSLFFAWYFSTGEPLLNSHFPTLLNQTENKQIFDVISTNLSVELSVDRIDKLLTSGLSLIIVSLDGSSAQSYSRYRRGGDFNLVVDNILKLREGKKKLGLEHPLIEWRFLVFEHNEHELSSARKLAKELGVDILEFFPGYAPDEGSEIRKTTLASIQPSIQGPAIDSGLLRDDTPLRRFMRHERWSFDHAASVQATPTSICDWLYFGTMIYPEGSVGACCVACDKNDDFSMLTAGTQFRETWNVDKFSKSRLFFKEQLEPSTICARCPMPGAQRYQFVQKIRSILLNAPQWVIATIKANFDEYFLGDDIVYLERELSAIKEIPCQKLEAIDCKNILLEYASFVSYDQELWKTAIELFPNNF